MYGQHIKSPNFDAYSVIFEQKELHYGSVVSQGTFNSK